MNKIGFDNIAGYKAELKELRDLSKVLKNSEDFLNRGFRLPRGLLLSGEPGVGKTIMAESLIADSNLNCVRIEIGNVDDDDLSDYLDEKFKEASANTPSIIFIDELDKICGETFIFGHGAAIETTGKFIKAMNDNQNDGVMVVATANDNDMLGESLMRSGRFDRVINIPLPSYEDRKEIIKYYSSNKRFDKKVDFETLAKITGSFTGADLECVINEAGINATIEDREEISFRDLEKSVNRIVFQGCEKNNSLNKLNRDVVAIHETGHLISELCLDKEGVGGVTIIPQGQSKGHMKIFKDPFNICQKQEVINKIIIALSGRAAEKVFKPEDDFIGSEDDIAKAYACARTLVQDSCFYGFEYYAGMQGRGRLGEGACSEERTIRIENKVCELINDCMNKAIELIESNKDLAEKYVRELKKKYSLTREEILKIYNKHTKGMSQKKEQ